MLVILGNNTEFQRVASLVINQMNFDNDINVSVFETNIRGKVYPLTTQSWILEEAIAKHYKKWRTCWLPACSPLPTIFSIFKDRNHNFSYNEFVVCTCFQFGQGQDFVLRYHFPKQALVFSCLPYKSFENTLGKGEIACNEHFLLFLQYFLPVWRTYCHFI